MGSTRDAGARRRWAVALACLALALAGEAHADGAAGSTSASARIDFKVVIPVMLRVHTVSQDRELSVTPADVERGYVDVPRATRLEVTSNSAGGLLVRLGFDRTLLSRVRASLAGQALEADSSQSLPLHAAKLVGAPLEVGYRLYLAPGTRPGTYAWPVSLALDPAA